MFFCFLLFFIQKHLLLFRSALLVGMGLLCIFGSKKADWSGAGPLAVLTLAFVAAYRWRNEVPKDQKVRHGSEKSFMTPIKNVLESVYWAVIDSPSLANTWMLAFCQTPYKWHTLKVIWWEFVLELPICTSLSDLCLILGIRKLKLSIIYKDEIQFFWWF